MAVLILLMSMFAVTFVINVLFGDIISHKIKVMKIRDEWKKKEK